MEVNLRRMKKQDLQEKIKDLPVETQKSFIELEKMKIQKQLDGSQLKSWNETRIWVSFLALIFLLLFLGLSIVPAVKEINIAKYKSTQTVNVTPIIPLLKP